MKRRGLTAVHGLVMLIGFMVDQPPLTGVPALHAGASRGAEERPIDASITTGYR